MKRARSIVSLFVVAASGLIASRAEARRTEGSIALGVIETLVPDLAYEFEEFPGRGHLVLSVPVVYEFPITETWTADVFAEPQFNSTAQRFRGAAGARLTLGPVWAQERAFFVEAGVLARRDAVGGFGGIGFAASRPPDTSALIGSISYRATVIDGGLRHTITVDLMRFGFNALRQ